MTTTTATETNRLPYFADMDDDALRASYRTYRTLAYNASQMAGYCRPNSRDSRKVAASWGRCLRACDIIEGLARKRGIRL